MNNNIEARADQLAEMMLDHFQNENKFEIELGSLMEAIVASLEQKGCTVIRHPQDSHLVTVICPRVTSAA